MMTANLNAFFELIIDWDNGRHIIVGVYKDNPHKIIVRISWTMNEDHVKALDIMQKEQRESILWNIRLALSQREDSIYMGDYHDSRLWISGQRMVYIEDLNRTSFFEALRGISITFRVISMLYGASFGIAKESPEKENARELYG